MSDDVQPPLKDRVGIVIYGTDWCPDCIRARRFLDRNNIAYAWIDIDRQKDAETMMRSVNGGKRSVPTIVFPDGSVLVEPSDRVLAEKLERAD